MFLIFHSSCGIPGPQFVKRQSSVEQNGSEIALIEHVLKLNEAVLEKLKILLEDFLRRRD
jgi:hypothetical protein